MMNGINNAWGMGWGWIISLIFLVFAILMIIRVMNHRRSNRNQPDNKTPLDILKVRYARGEITKQEFQEKKKAFS